MADDARGGYADDEDVVVIRGRDPHDALVQDKYYVQNGAHPEAAQPNGKLDSPPAKPRETQPPVDPKKATLEEGTLIKNRWTIAAKIGQGAFGETYIGCSVVEPGQTVAIKVERPNGSAKRDVLKTEVIALKKLQCDSVVRYVSSGRDEGLGINFLVMERLGSDVAELKKRTGKQTFELATTVRLGIQMLDSIRAVHEQHYLHRDIKPSNFVIGREDTSKVYLIDFGLARRYRSNDGTVRAARQPAGFRGTARYASIHSHKQMELGRRDDLWCLFYVLAEFRLDSGLPWRKHKEKNTIGEMKERFTNEKLVEKLPTQYFLFMKHLFSLRYETEPDYYYLKQLLESMAESERVPLTEPMEWQREGFEKVHGQKKAKPEPTPAPVVVDEVRTNPLNGPVELQEVAVPQPGTPPEPEVEPPRNGDAHVNDAYDIPPDQSSKGSGGHHHHHHHHEDANNGHANQANTPPVDAYMEEDPVPPAPLSTENEEAQPTPAKQDKPLQHAKGDKPSGYAAPPTAQAVENGAVDYEEADQAGAEQARGDQDEETSSEKAARAESQNGTVCKQCCSLM